jgi:hypothetical protein
MRGHFRSTGRSQTSSKMLKKSLFSHPPDPGALCHPPALRLSRQPPLPRDALCPMHRSRIVQILNGDPAASHILGGAHKHMGKCVFLGEETSVLPLGLR